MNKPSPDQTWQNRAKRIIQEREQITDIAGEADLTRGEESYFDVLEVQPDRSNDSEKYLISGSEESLATQASLLLALKKMMGTGSSPIDFDRWINNFEDGFSNWQNKSLRLSNPIKPWGNEKGVRPRIVKLKAITSLDYFAVEFFPDRDNLAESYLISGTQSHIIQQINLLWATINHLRLYDWGAILGYPMAQYLRQEPINGIELCIRLACFKKPPFRRVQFVGGFEYDIQPRQVTIAFPKRSAMNYATIRAACGGDEGLNWGDWWARAYVSPVPGATKYKGLAQMMACGPSKDRAKANLDKFLSLSEGYAVGRSHGQVDLDEGVRKDDPASVLLKKFDVYPAWCYVKNSDLVRFDDVRHKGRPTLSGKLVSKKNRLPLDESVEPPGWAQTLSDLMRSPLN